MAVRYIRGRICRVIGVKYQRGFWNLVIPAVAGLAGAALSSKSQKDAAESAGAAQQEVNAQNYAAQKEFAQHGVSWKVADAKAAGLHPLFALGGGSSSFSPSFNVAGGGYGGSDWGPAVAKMGQLLGGFLGKQQRQEYEGDGKMYDHPTMDELQGVRVSSVDRMESPRGEPLPDWEVGVGGGRMVQVLSGPSSDPMAKAWVSNVKDDPFWQRFAFGNGFSVVLPKTSEPQEVFEDKPLWFWAMVAKANVKEYGPGWLTQARAQFPSLREVWNGVVQELETSGILPSVRSAVPSFLKR